MSLVVAIRNESGIEIVADTYLTESSRGYRQSQRLQPRAGTLLDGALKSIVVHPALCIGYADGTVTAQEAIRALPVHRHAPFSLQEVLRHLELRSKQGADFIVASLAPTPLITTIENGTSRSGDDEHWIGDVAAYGVFRNRMKAGLGAGTAMGRVIDSDQIASVGGLSVQVRTKESKLNYVAAGEVGTGPVKAGPGTSDDDIDPDWDTAAGGAHFMTTVRPKEQGVGAFGFYAYQGKVGGLFYPNAEERGIPYVGISYDEFLREVEQDYGLALFGHGVRVVAPRSVELY